MRKTVRVFGLALGLILLGALATLAQMQPIRCLGTVTDEGGKPLADVSVTVSDPNIDVALTVTARTNKKGKYSITLPVKVSRPRTLRFLLEKEGFEKIEKDVRPNYASEVNVRVKEDFQMRSEAAVKAEQMALAEQMEGNQAAQIFNQGAEAFNAGDPEAAKAKFHEALEVDPQLAAAWGALSVINYSEKNYAEAAAAAEKVLEIEPTDERALELRYDSYLGAGDMEKANASLDALAAAVSGQPVAARVFNAGAEEARAGHIDEAIRRFEQAIEIYPELSAAYSALSNIALSKGQNDKVLTYTDKMLELDAEDVGALSLRYEALRALGRVEEAKVIFDRLAGTDPEVAAEAFYKQGVALFNSGKMDDAQTAFERVLQADASYAKAHYMLGLCFVNRGDIGQAKEHLRTFVEMAPQDPDAPTAKEMLQAL